VVRNILLTALFTPPSAQADIQRHTHCEMNSALTEALGWWASRARICVSFKI
jgi:hypothetical protein